jgi:hypothetical protein
MPVVSTIIIESPTEALIVEQALAYARQLTTAMDTAPDGQVIDRAESVALNQGRNFVRRSLEIAIQSQAETVEKKGHQTASVTAVAVATTKVK